MAGEHRQSPTSTTDAMEVARGSAARMYADDRATRALGISIEEVGPGRATARMRVTAEMTNGHGIAHGGYVFLLADTAFAYACNSYGPVTVAQEGQITFLRPAAEGDELTASAAERARMERSGIYDVTVHRADGQVMAEFRGHSRTVPQRDRAGSGSSA
jgi:acyl-CoA thioesterase